MISAFKRLVKTNDASINSNPLTNSVASNSNESNGHINAASFTSTINNGVQMISHSLQKKFSKGVNYNMKIVIKGDYNVGKTCLWLRLQGHQFKEQYESSDEIKVANINWNYRGAEDVVKVEVWDVVDRSKKKRNLLQQAAASTTSLKLDNNDISNGAKLPVEASLDAEFIDVYKNTNGCIIVYDITKQWTWEYVERELPKIPAHIPVLVIGNHRDMQHHRTVDELKCKFFLESLNRGTLSSTVRYMEASMRTGFGLAYLYKFFNIPFLQLRRENLMQQLEINAKDMDNICEELQHMEENINDEYDAFSNKLNSTRRQQQEENAKEALKNAKSIEEAKKLAMEREAAAATAAEQAAVAANLAEPKKLINNFLNKLNTKVVQPNTPAPISMSVTIDPNSDVKNLLNMKNSLSLNEINNNKKNANSNLGQLRTNSKSPVNARLFGDHHDDELNKFLEDNAKPSNSNSHSLPADNSQQNDDDEEEVSLNPMVAAFNENIDSSDEDMTKLKDKLKISPVKNEVDDDEEKNNKDHNLKIEQGNSTNLFVEMEYRRHQSEDNKNSSVSQIQLNNDDFLFLESLSSTKSITNSLNPTELADTETDNKTSKSNKLSKTSSTSSKSKGSSSKSSKKKTSDISEAESVDSSNKKSSSLSSKKKSTSSSSSKSKSSSKKEKKSSTNLNSYFENELNDEYNDRSLNIHIKKDIDYEDI